MLNIIKTAEYAVTSRVDEIEESISDTQKDVDKLRDNCYTLVKDTKQEIEEKIDNVNNELNNYKECMKEKMKYLQIAAACLCFGLLCAGVSLICICLAIS